MMTEKVNAMERSKKIMMTTMMMIGGGESVVGNNNSNLVTFPMSALIDLSGEKEEDNKSRDIAQIDIKGTLSEAINRYSVVGKNNANLVTIPMSALIDLSEEKEEENNYTYIDGTVDGTDNVIISLEHVCVDDRKNEGEGEIKDNDDDYNDDDGGRREDCCW